MTIIEVLNIAIKVLYIGVPVIILIKIMAVLFLMMFDK